jgi:hypothetical protein
MVRRKALVIGAQTGRLTGVQNDVETMTNLLSERRFTIDCRTGERATRDGILDAFERLITDARSADATVVYFSGHGTRAEADTPAGNPLPALQFIVPTDYDESRPGDFRGITALELSVLLARLTEKTRNATVIFDCCHAGHMVRDNSLRMKALPHPSYLDVGEHLGILRARGLPVDLPDVVANPWLVRLDACAPWQSAFEYRRRDGLTAGVLTDSLKLCVEQIGTARVPWSLVVQSVRNRVSTLFLGQRPEVSGPTRRFLFETDEAGGGNALAAVHIVADRLTLPGAALLGVMPGDRLGLTPAGVPAATTGTTVAHATVTKTDGVTAEAIVEMCDGHAALPVPVVAHPLVMAAPRDTVRVLGEGALADLTSAAIDAVPGLRASRDGEPVGGDAVLAEVEVGESIALWDGGSEPLVRTSASPEDVDGLVAVLRRLAHTARLRRLAPAAGEELTDPFVVELGRVVDGDPEPLPATGALLRVGEAIYLTLRNDGDRQLFFHVFDLGVAGATTLVTARDPSGLRVRHKHAEVLGARDRGGFEGIRLDWPAGVPMTDPRPESILVIVTATAHDLSLLTHEGVGGTARTVAPGGRFAVVRFDYVLSPGPA